MLKCQILNILKIYQQINIFIKRQKQKTHPIRYNNTLADY